MLDSGMSPRTGNQQGSRPPLGTDRINNIREIIADKVMEGANRALLRFPHSILARSLVAQCVLAYLEDFAPKEYTVENLLRHINAREIPRTLIQPIQIALHFRADGSMSTPDVVVLANRLTKEAFIELSTARPATAAILGVAPSQQLEGIPLFKEIWSTEAANHLLATPSEGLVNSIAMNVFKAIGSHIESPTRRGRRSSKIKALRKAVQRNPIDQFAPDGLQVSAFDRSGPSPAGQPASPKTTTPSPPATPTSSKPSHKQVLQRTHDELFDLLMNARRADLAILYLKNGRTFTGAIVFNEFGGTGRLINVEQAFSYDFGINDLKDVRLS